ncbi:MAG: DsbA family protein [Gammaproteobacteria bacterium]|nr:MAG: DsbA family protein [Gammaproteobacteria bacterium]
MTRFTKTALATAFIAFATQSYAANTATPAVSPQQRAQIESVVHQYLVQHPEVIVEAVQNLQRKQFEDAQKTVKQTQLHATKYTDALFHQTDDPVGGNPNGKITIVEFFDYQCPHCVDMAPVMEAILKTNPDVRIVYKEFPIRGPASETAARAALAANKQGKYVDFSHALLTVNQPLTPDLIFQLAQKNGLNVDQLKKDMNDPTITNQIKTNFKLAQDLKLFGTPAFFIAKSDAVQNKGGVSYLPGALNQQQLQDAIDKIGK